MNYSRRFLPPLVSSAVALIAVTNYSVMILLNDPGSAAQDILPHFLSISIPTSVAVVLVMSSLYHALIGSVAELDQGREILIRKSQRDTLTGVASRGHFEEQLAEAIKRFRQNGDRFAVVMLDLDHFKKVNDLHGHPMGDELLKEAAKRIEGQLAQGDIVARLGGDEFAVLQRHVSKNEDARALCASICNTLSHPYEIGNLELRLSCSIGAAMASQHIDGTADYLRAADVALYDAKARGRNCHRFFSRKLDNSIKRKDRLETDLRRAIRSGQDIDLAFQPQIGARGTLTGVEVLFRWRHPDLGDISAAEAVSIAEESDLILELGDFVLRGASRFAREYPELSVAINLSPAQFSRSPDFAQFARRRVREVGVRPEQIEFEITERLIMEIGSDCDSQIQGLRKSGFRVALDDFGTGYSSLSYLRRFQVDRLKLDKSFVEGSEIQESVAIVRAAVGLAHMLGLEVIAEGIETTPQEAIALESGCDGLQGYLYGAPMSSEEFSRYVRGSLRTAA